MPVYQSGPNASFHNHGDYNDVAGNQTITHEYGDNYNGNIIGSNVGGRGNQNTVNNMKEHFNVAFNIGSVDGRPPSNLQPPTVSSPARSAQQPGTVATKPAEGHSSPPINMQTEEPSARLEKRPLRLLCLGNVYHRHALWYSFDGS